MRFLIIGPIALGAWLGACVHQSAATSSTSSGEVALGGNGGAWIDSAGGMWMDGAGNMSLGPGRSPIGLEPAAIAAMTDANIAAHLGTGDSLEVALSEFGAAHASDAGVRKFAQHMVNEHTAHLQDAQTMLNRAGLVPAPSPLDTMDMAMAARMRTRLMARAGGADFDRELVRDEVMMHRHMLHDLQALQPQSKGATRLLVDQTIPIVRRHLAEAEVLWNRIGGASGAS
ncbi:MAG TPA: DUF4142 domain-containing protein [Gemmatimonadaceae bacterium]|jgi:putative membrane protein|nr:DUF4142 domain-containing protein [Gemmatimonadaceae bacterium]